MRDKTESVASRYFGRIICQSSPNIIVNQMNGNKTTQGQKLYLENRRTYLVISCIQMATQSTLKPK